jgi:sugar lactone lactonase YvrE
MMMGTSMKKTVGLLAIIVLALAAYLSLWPVPIEPVSWNAPSAPGYTGPHTANKLLANLKMISLGTEEGPEHIVLARDGKLYTTVASGNILRMNPDGSAQEVFANTGGRVLGFDFDAADNMVAADAVKGLLSISPDKKITLLTDKVGTEPILYADAFIVAVNGKIYVSDASTRFAPAQWGGTFEASVLDILEQSATGRILEYDPATKATRVVAKGLSFANGVALSQDQQTLFVNETGKYRV